MPMWEDMNNAQGAAWPPAHACLHCAALRRNGPLVLAHNQHPEARPTPTAISSSALPSLRSLALTGGKWIYNEKRDTGVSNKSLDNMWLYTMLCLVGENFAEAEEVCRHPSLGQPFPCAALAIV